MNFWCFYCFEKEKKRERIMILQKNPVHFKEIPLFMRLLFPLLSHGGSVHVNEIWEEIFVLFLLFFFQRRAGASLRAVFNLISKQRESSWRSTSGLKGRFKVVGSRFETRWKWIRSLCWGEKIAIMGKKGFYFKLSETGAKVSGNKEMHLCSLFCSRAYWTRIFCFTRNICGGIWCFLSTKKTKMNWNEINTPAQMTLLFGGKENTMQKLYRFFFFCFFFTWCVLI